MRLAWGIVLMEEKIPTFLGRSGNFNFELTIKETETSVTI